MLVWTCEMVKLAFFGLKSYGKDFGMSKKIKSSANKASDSKTPLRSGKFLGIRIADPAVRPKTVTVAKIRHAVREATKIDSKRSTAK